MGYALCAPTLCSHLLTPIHRVLRHTVSFINSNEAAKIFNRNALPVPVFLDLSKEVGCFPHLPITCVADYHQALKEKCMYGRKRSNDNERESRE
jgi:hypothetical protein